MITSEEKMRNNQWQQAGWIAGWILRHNLTAAIANSATAFVELQDHLAALQESALTGSGLDGYAKELLQFHDEIEESEYTTLDVQELNALTRLGWLDKTGLCAWELTDEGRYVVGIMDELRRMAESTMEGEK